MIDVSALAAYFAVMSITPGPNNVMVTASGAAFGYRATLPHVVGIGLGGCSMPGTVSETDARRPFTIWQAMLFQAINPKAWVMAITTAAVFLPRATPFAHLVVVVGGIFLVVNMPCVSVWALFGSSVRHLLLRPAYRRVFNLTMSILLVLTAVPGLRG